ncbi:hypothetical protein B0T18DRAFT_413481 [Schizothecium vesticola]|uniref:Uncharacterized protein n=1 Tax=Schizothecium vesticola TaxID=314040 RepID=A0AA40ENQ1_9PEZI|nr:hypothetical protein B0T18DRAFT_413481 [Schizothecium vesticola]
MDRRGLKARLLATFSLSSLSAPRKRGIHVVFPIPPNDDVEHDVDIVMVHGLNGDCFATWTKNGCF